MNASITVFINDPSKRLRANWWAVKLVSLNFLLILFESKLMFRLISVFLTVLFRALLANYTAWSLPTLLLLRWVIIIHQLAARIFLFTSAVFNLYRIRHNSRASIFPQLRWQSRYLNLTTTRYHSSKFFYRRLTILAAELSCLLRLSIL